MRDVYLAQAAGPVAAVGIVLLYLVLNPFARLLGLVVTLVGAGLTVPLLLPEGSRVKLALAGAVGLGVVLVLGAIVRRWPWLLAFLALAAAPARIPVEVGDTEANLLLPLYLVVGAAVVALAWSLVQDPPRFRELGPVGWPLAGVAGWLLISTAWADDHREASIDLIFFLVPFAILAVALARLPWSHRQLAWLVRLLGAMAVLFSVVGIYQWAAKDVFWNPKVEVGNEFQRFFRVNSLFWDPSIYGRFLVVAILVLLAVLLLRREGRWTLPAVAVVAVSCVGLLLSYSQSSFVALGVGVALLMLLAWRWRALVAVALVAAVAAPVAIFAPQLERARNTIFHDQDGGLDRASSGRFDLAKTGGRVALDHPAIGVGLGGYADAYAAEKGLRRTPDTAASHTTPVTVAAETGFPGLALWLGLVLTALVSTVWGLGRGNALPRHVAYAAGVVVAAITVHSLFYSAFFEDPLLWGSLAFLGFARANRDAPEV